jgi:GxxExxY protein
MNTDKDKFNTITEQIIAAAFRVHNELGCGFLEKVYENSMAHELRKRGLNVVQQVGVDVKYDGVVVGQYIADLIVEGVIIIELKAIKAIDEFHAAQCINYITATGLPLCLLINFGKRVEIKRFAGPSS